MKHCETFETKKERIEFYEHAFLLLRLDEVQ